MTEQILQDDIQLDIKLPMECDTKSTKSNRKRPFTSRSVTPSGRRLPFSKAPAPSARVKHTTADAIGFNKTKYMKAMSLFHKRKYKKALVVFQQVHEFVKKIATSQTGEGVLGLIVCRFIGHCHFLLEDFHSCRIYYMKARSMAKAMNRLEDFFRLEFHICLLDLRIISDHILEESNQLQPQERQELSQAKTGFYAFDSTSRPASRSAMSSSINERKLNNDEDVLMAMRTFSQQYLESYWWNEVTDRSVLAKISLVIGNSICTLLSPARCKEYIDPSWLESPTITLIENGAQSSNGRKVQYSLLDFAEKCFQNSIKYFLQLSKKRFSYKINSMYSQYHLAMYYQTHMRDYKKAVQLYSEVYSFFVDLLKKGKRLYSDDELEVDEDKERDMALLDETLWIVPDVMKELLPTETKWRGKIVKSRKETMIDKEFNRYVIPPYYDVARQCVEHMELCYYFMKDCGKALAICESFKSLRLRLFLCSSTENFTDKELTVVDLKKLSIESESTFVVYQAVAQQKLLLIWIVTPGESDCHCIRLPELTSLIPDPNNDVAPLRRSKLKQLYEIFISPISHLLPDSPEQNLIIIPDENLPTISFPSLINPENDHFMIQEHSICISESFLYLEYSNSLKRYSIPQHHKETRGYFISGSQAWEKPILKDSIPRNNMHALASIFDQAAMLKGKEDSEIRWSTARGASSLIAETLKQKVPFAVCIPQISIPQKVESEVELLFPSPCHLNLSTSSIDFGPSKQNCQLKGIDLSGTRVIIASSYDDFITIRDIFTLFRSFFFKGVSSTIILNGHNEFTHSILCDIWKDIFQVSHERKVFKQKSSLLLQAKPNLDVECDCEDEEQDATNIGSTLTMSQAVAESSIPSPRLTSPLKSSFLKAKGRLALSPTFKLPSKSSSSPNDNSPNNLPTLESPKNTLLSQILPHSQFKKSLSFSQNLIKGIEETPPEVLSLPSTKTFSHCVRRSLLKAMSNVDPEQLDLIPSLILLVGDPYGPFLQRNEKEISSNTMTSPPLSPLQSPRSPRIFKSTYSNYSAQQLALLPRHLQETSTFDFINDEIESMSKETIQFLKSRKNHLKNQHSDSYHTLMNAPYQINTEAPSSIEIELEEEFEILVE